MPSQKIRTCTGRDAEACDGLEHMWVHRDTTSEDTISGYEASGYEASVHEVSGHGALGRVGLEAAWGRYAIMDDMREPYAGIPVGVICIKLDYPKVPGNVVNAETFPFSVRYEVLEFEIERLFEGDPSLEQLVVDAAKRLETAGVKAIVGACGYFAHFQQVVANAVDVPVYLSSLCQLPMIRLGCGSNASIGVLCANGENLDQAILSQIGENTDGLIVADVSELESFSAIRWGKGVLDNVALSSDLAALTKQMKESNPNMEVILLECSDLPPYAYDIQQACGLPVYDFVTLIKWVALSVTQRRYI